MRAIIVFIFLCTLSIGAWADELSDELLTLGYVEHEVPNVGSDTWSAANRSFPAVYVGKNHSLVVRNATRAEEDSSEIIYDAGSVKYIGIDHGEFGGGLYINEFKKDSEPFFKANIRALIPIEGDLYIISGLAHMGFSGGAIHVIRNYKEPSRPEQVTLLPDAPEAITVGKSWRGTTKLVIAGHSSLIEFIPDTELEVVAFNAFWSSLYPCSVVEHKKNYLIGIRSGIAVVTSGYGQAKLRYFVPN